MVARPASSIAARSVLPYAIFYAAIIALSLPIYGYDWHLTLHILGAVIFIGNIIVTAVWMVLAEQTGNTPTIQFAARAITRADLFFTAPGVILLLLNGLALASMRWGGWSEFYEYDWISAGLALLAITAVVWVTMLLPRQIQMERISSSTPGGQDLSTEFYSLLHRWYVWGSIAVILPLIALVLMVTKPDLW